MGGIADAQQAGSRPGREPVHSHAQELDVMPILKLGQPVA